MTTTPATGPTHYLAPGRLTRRVLNPTVTWLTRRGLSLWGSRVLEVRGRRSGEWRSTPVNVLEVDGRSYLVAARGRTEWVRNLEVAGDGRLRLGRRSWAFTASSVPDEQKTAVLRAYLRRWAWEVGAFFEGVDADSSDDELRAAAGRHPVFAIDVAATAI